MVVGGTKKFREIVIHPSLTIANNLTDHHNPDMFGTQK